MQEQQKRFATQDGIELSYRYRPTTDGSADKAVVLFHRGCEHSGRTMFVADELGFDNFAYSAWDACDHGHNPDERGDSLSIGTSVAGVDDFICHIQSECGIKPENICVVV